MIVQLDRNENPQSVNKLTVFIDDVEFVISVDKFGGLNVMKNQMGGGDGSILITPSVSNVIILK
jgi:hypothetical protein